MTIFINIGSKFFFIAFLALLPFILVGCPGQTQEEDDDSDYAGDDSDDDATDDSQGDDSDGADDDEGDDNTSDDTGDDDSSADDSTDDDEDDDSAGDDSTDDDADDDTALPDTGIFLIGQMLSDYSAAVYQQVDGEWISVPVPDPPPFYAIYYLGMFLPLYAIDGESIWAVWNVIDEYWWTTIGFDLYEYRPATGWVRRMINPFGMNVMGFDALASDSAYLSYGNEVGINRLTYYNGTGFSLVSSSLDILLSMHHTAPGEGVRSYWDEYAFGRVVRVTGGVETPMTLPAGYETGYLNSIRLEDSDNGWAIGVNEDWDQTLLRLAGGAWSIEPSPSGAQAQYPYAVEFSEDGYGVVTNSDRAGEVWAYDGGAWQKLLVPVVYGIYHRYQTDPHVLGYRHFYVGVYGNDDPFELFEYNQGTFTAIPTPAGFAAITIFTLGDGAPARAPVSFW